MTFCKHTQCSNRAESLFKMISMAVVPSTHFLAPPSRPLSRSNPSEDVLFAAVRPLRLRFHLADPLKHRLGSCIHHRLKKVSHNKSALSFRAVGRHVWPAARRAAANAAAFGGALRCDKRTRKRDASRPRSARVGSHRLARAAAGRALPTPTPTVLSVRRPAERCAVLA